MNAKPLALTLLVASMLAGAAEVPIRKSAGTLVDGAGMTLYTFDKDTTDKSTCNAACATTWPPVKAPATAKPQGDYTVAARDDGSKQWGYKGKPLYTYAKDKAGEKTGESVAGWRLAK